ncbi:MAG: D-alanyl-D-alanine carboxypeptidase family protein [Clostridia bacterium]
MKKTNKFTKFLMILCIIFNILCPIAFADEDIMEQVPEISAYSYMLFDQDTGNILASENIDEKVYPASTTKILSAIVILENAELDEIVTVTEDAYWNIVVGSSSAGIVEGEQMTVEDMLYCMMLASANEAANALAIHVAGSVENFVGMMNLKAVQLGAYDSNFMNPNGLHDENHYTTAHDMSIITKFALKNETFATIVKTAQKTIPATNMNDEKKVYTTNYLIYRKTDPRYYQYANGIKTGTTTPAGNCLISQATKNDMNLIALIFGCEKNPDTGENMVFYKMVELFEWGFSNYYTVTLVEQLEPKITVPVRLSSQNDYISMKTANDVVGLVPNDYDSTKLEFKYSVPEVIDAPIEVDEKLGTVQVSYDGVYYGTIDLLAVNDVEMSQVLYYVDVLEQFFVSSTFKIILSSLVLLLFLSVFGARIQRHNRKKKKRYKGKNINNRYR